MGVYTFTQEFKCKVPAKRVFKAFVTETHDVLPKIVPHAVKKIENTHGDGGVITHRLTHFADGFPFSHAKYHFHHFDAEKLEVKFTLVEGGGIGGDLESLVYDQKYENTPDGGSVVKITREWHTKGDAKVDETIVKADEESYVQVGKAVEDYLIAHPEICAA